MGAPLKEGVLAGRSRDFALEIGSLMVSFQYYQLQSLIWSWLADKQAPLDRISESLGSADPLAGRVRASYNQVSRTPVFFFPKEQEQLRTKESK